MKMMFFIMALASAVFADIYEVSSIKEMDKYREEGVLFLYDIDNTLVTLDQMLGSDQWFVYRFNELIAEMNNTQEALDKALAEWTSVQYISKIHEVEKGSSQMIKSQQESGVMCIGFTTRGLTLSHCALSQLNSIGIDFTLSAPVKHDLLFLTSQSIIFRHGVLFTAGTHKGTTLIEFLNQMNFTPTKVVFINDKHKDLTQVEEGCNRLGIPFIGLRYNYLDEEVAAFDPEIAKLQGDKFFNIMSNEQALRLKK